MTDTAPQPAAPDTQRQQRYTAVAIALHWIIAFSIIGMIAVGWTMGTMDPGPDYFAVVQLHKSFGITILLLSVARLIWRLMNPPPPEPPMPKWQGFLANAVHVLFYVLIIAMPLTGWIMASASSDAPTRYFGLVDIRLPGIPALDAGTREGLEEGFEEVHGNLAWVIIGLLVLHVAGALKHQFVDKDGLIARMAPGLFGRTAGPPDHGQGHIWAFGAAALIFASIVGFSLSTTRPNEAIAANATEEEQQPASNAPAWTVDYGKSSLKFRAGYQGDAFEGVFSDWTAQIQLDTAAAPNPDTPIDGYIRVAIPMGKVSTGETYFDENVTQGDWFDVAKHPEAVFEVTGGVYKLSDTQYEATGVLKLKGVDHPVRLPFTLSLDGNTATAHGEVTLRRLDLGVGADTLAKPKGDAEWVANDVAVVIDVTATRQ
jgi:cytochrome b561/polyisoprenoid-binding protein YceI